MTLFLVFISGVLDRIRGTGFDILQNRIFDKFALGWAVALLAGIPSWWQLLFVPLFAIGISTGLSEPIGAMLLNRPMQVDHLEFWQKGVLKTNTWLALIARGFITIVPLLVMVFWLPQIWLVGIGYAFGFTLAPLFARWLPEKFFPLVFPERWAAQEYMRSWIANTVLVLLLVVVSKYHDHNLMFF